MAGRGWLQGLAVHRPTIQVWTVGTIAMPPEPPAETFHLLAESGDALLTEAGDFLDPDP
jgi:hypothetical protein